MRRTRVKNYGRTSVRLREWISAFLSKNTFHVSSPSLRVTLDKPLSSKSISSVSPSAPCKYIIRVLLYGATSLQMNFLERFLPPSGRQTQKRRARWLRGGERGRERGNVESGRGARGDEEKIVKWRRTMREWRGGKEEVEKKTSTRQSERQWVAPYRGIETEYVR